MGFLDLFKGVDINEGVQAFKETKNALLLDVRTPEEYKDGHIEGSVNLPLQSISNIKSMSIGKDRPIFVHCLSGSRSSQATAKLKKLGYANVTNIGGISAYRGKVVR